ncbi:MAG: hypothetical protein L0332_21480 [Chloroflexi bacterium]|nr:hypothetical protein [Chloroflexota bacterium]MCI0577998.1 hypothetical protein [Chloroflexota bacterium]MCI0646973.1 hypothetical protein [Chloroflexota bacterium]MCI0729268.1 hypothetical protein [Chloroflexota bacterium]
MNDEHQPGFLSRLGRAILWFLKLIIVILLAFGLGLAGYFGWQWLSSSANAFSSNSGLLRSDVNTLMERETSQRQQLSDLQATVDNQEGRLAALENSGMEEALAQQEAVLQSLESQLATVVAGSQTITGNVASLSAGLIALQSDLNENAGRVDELGGQVDSLNSQVGVLDSGLVELGAASAEPAEAVERLEQALSLFRIWELIARARLRLAESNYGLATSDVQQALAGVDALVAADPAGASETLQLVQVRLALALGSLPGDPVAAARDLEAAWEALDRLLATLVLPASLPAAPEITATTPAGTPAATETPAATPTPGD